MCIYKSAHCTKHLRSWIVEMCSLELLNYSVAVSTCILMSALCDHLTALLWSSTCQVQYSLAHTLTYRKHYGY